MTILQFIVTKLSMQTGTNQRITMPGNGLSKCVHLSWNVRISQVFLDSLQSSIPKILTNLSGNQLFRAFPSEIQAFWVKCAHLELKYA